MPTISPVLGSVRNPSLTPLPESFTWVSSAPSTGALSPETLFFCLAIAAAPISRTLKMISTCEMGTPKPFITVAASRNDSPNPHSTTDSTLVRSECLQPGDSPEGVTVTLAPQCWHWYCTTRTWVSFRSTTGRVS